MKKEFRIIEHKTCNDLGECKTFYYIQKKWFYWWFDYRFNIFNDNNTLSKTYQCFEYEKECVKMIEELKEDDCIYYKRNKIIRAFTYGNLNQTFVNASKFKWKDYIGYTYYHYSYSLNTLKKEIDKSIITKTKRVV